MPELADMRLQAEANLVADPGGQSAIIGCTSSVDVLLSVADTGRGADGTRRYVVTPAARDGRRRAQEGIGY